MGKNVLVIGGSYFYGRVFALLASKEVGFSLTLLNRGRYSMSGLPNLSEYHCDRHNITALRGIPAAHYDAIIDFCGYQPGDVSSVIENLPCTADCYIFISTADVYQRGTNAWPDESFPLLSDRMPGPVGDYIWNKILLERELQEACDKRGMNYVIFRPSFLYGPYNYAPREAFFFERIIHGQPVPYPTDAVGEFQFIYVKDAALALIAAIENPQENRSVFNLSAPEVHTYASYYDTLRQVCDLPFSTESVTVREVLERSIALPFPLTAQERECYTAEKAVQKLGIAYTPLSDGLAKTYASMKSVFTGR